MRARRRQAGMTLMEIMIAIAILAVMMTLAWKTIANTSDTKKTFERYAEHNHELRMALGRIVRDFEGIYLSRNEDTSSANPRTLLVSRTGGRLPEIRFSTLGHRVLWADANESEQTAISYVARDNPDKPGVVDWVRREQRRVSNEPPENEPADYDILVRDIASAKLEFWNWKTVEWQDTWDTTQSDGQKGWLPSRMRITIATKGLNGQEYKVMTEARVWMQEALLFSITG